MNHPEEREAIASAIQAGVNSSRQRILDNLERGKRENLLEVIVDMQRQLTQGQVVDDIRLAKKFSWERSEIQDLLAHLQEDGYVTLTEVGDSLAVTVTKQGYRVVGGKEPYETIE